MRVKIVSSLIVIAILSTILFLVLSNKIDQSLVGNDICSPPCVAGIQPGLTSTTDALQILKNLKTSDESNPTVLESGIIRSKVEGTYYYFYSKDSLITQIDTRPKSTNLKEVINLFGEPSYLNKGKIRDGYYFVSLFYPEKGLVFVIGGNKELYTIEPNMSVAKAIFLEPSDITTIINSLYGKEIIEETLANIQEWKGYGNYLNNDFE